MAPRWKHLGVWVYAPLVLIVVSALTFIYLVQASYVAGQVRRMAKLEQDLHKVKQLISETRLQIADNAGLERIQTEARRMGFRQPESIQYIEVYLPATASSETGSASGSASEGLSASQRPKSGGGLISAAIQQFRDWAIPRQAGPP